MLGWLVGLLLLVPAAPAMAASDAGAASDHAPVSRAGDPSVFMELFGHLEPHALTAFWFGGSAGFAQVAPYEADADGKPLHGSPDHPELFHSPAEFEAHYAAMYDGGWGFMIYNINTAMWIAALLLLVIFIPMARKARSFGDGAPKGRFYGMLEALVLFVRDDMVYETMGKQHGRRFLPLFLTLFFFIFLMNLLGLVWLPFGIGGTATANLAVTEGLAAVTFLTIHVSGLREHGPIKHWTNLIPHGLPVFAIPIVAVVELLGVVVKPGALMVRLFANMTAGHLIVLALFGLVYFFNSWIIAPAPLAMAVFIYGLEVFVALIQAYVFTFLSILFVGWAVHPDH